MSKSKDDFIWKYLPHATLKDIASEGKGSFAAWIVVSGISILFGVIFNFGAEALDVDESGKWYGFFPNWVWYGIIYAGFMWIARGEEYKFVVPNLGFKSWLFLSLIMTAVFAVFEYFLWWVGVPFLFGVIFFVQFLDSLALKGKSNFELVDSSEQESF